MPFLDDVDSPDASQERQHPWTTIAVLHPWSARIAANDIRKPPLGR
jgi:hypothetical protein